MCIYIPSCIHTYMYISIHVHIQYDASECIHMHIWAYMQLYLYTYIYIVPARIWVSQFVGSFQALTGLSRIDFSQWRSDSHRRAALNRIGMVTRAGCCPLWKSFVSDMHIYINIYMDNTMNISHGCLRAISNGKFMYCKVGNHHQCLTH